MWTILNRIGAVASVIALSGLCFSPSWRTASAVTLVAIVVVYLSAIFLTSTGPAARHGKEALIRKGIQVIDSANRSIIMFASDMSWVHSYSASIRSAISRGVEVKVFYDRADTSEVATNRGLLRKLGVKVLMIPKDCGFRGTLVDHSSASSSILFVARKMRSREGASAKIGSSGTESSFNYACRVYNGTNDPDIVVLAAAFYDSLLQHSHDE